MAKFSKKNRQKIQPMVEGIFDEIELFLKKHKDLGNFSLGSFQLIDKNDLLHCECGIETVMLPNGTLIKRCKACPPPPPPDEN